MKTNLQNFIRNKKILFFLVSLLGILTSFSLPPYNYFFINFLSLSLFFFLFIKSEVLKNKLDYFLYGWFFGIGYFLSSLYWISISLTFDPEFKILIPISIVLIPSFLALFFATSVFLSSYFIRQSSIVLVLVFSLLLGCLEFLRGMILTGFPWNLFVYSFSNNLAFLQSLSIFGTYGLNLITITFFLIPSIFFLKKSKTDYIVLIVMISIFISFFIFGNYRLNNEKNFTQIKTDFKIKVLASQIDIDRFYNPKFEAEIIKNLLNQSEADKSVPTIFIWPEGVITSSFLEDIKIYKHLFDKNIGHDDLVILGINDINREQDNKIFNSFVILDKKLNIVSLYYKNKLVPFGEFIPFERILKKTGLRKITNNYSSFSKGSERKIIQLKKLKILPLICYEIIYSGNLSKQKNFDVVINISEDGWFGKSIGPKQHFVHSIYRSIEEGKSVIRSSNNGTSAVINARGNIVQSIESTKGGVIDISSLEKPNKNTFFSKYNNNIFFYLCLFYITLIFFLKRIRR